MTTIPAPLPPTTLLTSKPISQSTAHDFLAAYLDRANTDPALQPNAGISEHGPVSRTTAAAPNLMLHNLKRVQAGLAGEVLGRDLALANLSAEGGAAQTNGGAEWEDAKEFEVKEQPDVVQYEDEGEGVPMEVDGDGEGGVDKEERKRKKKERRLAEKKAKMNKNKD
ncbi:uncharacterized protein BDW47DRAFT_112248 [Aspergillus candidus]|uniref:Uncharacterized protein n=1 Tax=Aspergillus candidus TaxID=41067 RepID=A0A2I2F1A0_ASPCN|nr:hypothetical protein BDW47DRAFT_112248 [Aspergillus candidus]PLB34414.1 hypothetical protein BDW47DRAFT_112248 [Aspergillus candidus]